MNVVYLLKLAKGNLKPYGIQVQDNESCLLIVTMPSQQRNTSDLFPSLIRIRAANGTEIENKGECDITFRIGQTKFTFPFCAQIVCQNSSYLGIIFLEHFTLGPLGVLMI